MKLCHQANYCYYQLFQLAEDSMTRAAVKSFPALQLTYVMMQIFRAKEILQNGSHLMRQASNGIIPKIINMLKF